MPRVAIKKRDYIKKDMSAWIVKQTYQKGVTNEQLADVLHIHRNTLKRKLDNTTFTFEELVTLFEYFETPDGEILNVMKGVP